MPPSSSNAHTIAFQHFLWTIQHGDIDEMRRQLQQHDWMNNPSKAVAAIVQLNQAEQRKQNALPKETVNATAMALTEHIHTPLIWQTVFNFITKQMNMNMSAIWPGFVRALEHMKPQSMEMVLNIALQRCQDSALAWVSDALQRHPSHKKLSGKIFWLAAQHPDPTLLRQLMQHPAKPSSQKILDEWRIHWKKLPIHLEEIRHHLSLEPVLTQAVQFALHVQKNTGDGHHLDETLQFWWNALTQKEKRGWLKRQLSKNDSFFHLPMVQVWHEQQALQMVAPEKPTTKKHRL